MLLAPDGSARLLQSSPELLLGVVPTASRTDHYIKLEPQSSVVLFTDDHRLAAIKTYLKLGFEPQMVHDSHPERWREVLAKLGWQAPATATA